MAGPWDQYAKPEQPESGPWGNYAKADSNVKPEASAEPVSRTEKLLRGIKDPLDGAAQLFEKVMPDGFNSANRTVNNWIAEKTGMLAHMPTPLEAAISGGGVGVDGLIKQQEAQYQAKRAAAGESGFDGYRTIGNVVSPANLAIASKIPAAATLAGRVGVGALGGGVSAALNPVMDGDFWKGKGEQVAMGAAFGGVVPAVTGGIARVISPNASKDTGLALLKSEGVKPTIGQTLGGWANTVEEKAQSLPIVGDAITAARNRARDQFNTAAINRATSPIGVKSTGSGASAVAEAGDAIGAVYDKAKSQMGGFKIDSQANAELSQLQSLAARGLEGKERKAVQSYFKDYLTKPSLTAQSFKELDSKLNADIARFNGGDAYQKKVGEALMEVQRIVTDNAKRANPAAAELFKKADTAWANLVRVEGASVAAKGTGGVFTPGQLLTAVRGADKSVRDRATARGTALMQDLANAGQSALGNKVPNSGTADRLMLGAAGLGAGFANPAIPLGLLAGASAYTPWAQSLLRGAVSNRYDFAEPTAKAFRKAAPMLIPGGAQVGLGLLN